MNCFFLLILFFESIVIKIFSIEKVDVNVVNKNRIKNVNKKIILNGI